MKQSESIEKLAPALVAAQAEIGGAVKGSSNPFFKSNYADLNSVILELKPIFVRHGFAVIQLPVSDENGVGVSTRIQHTSGEYIEQSFTLPLAKNDPQAAGSAITYAKRYSLKALGLMPDLDDDGEAAMFRQEKVFTEDQRSTFIDMIANKDGWGLKRMGQEVGNDVMSGLFSSFQKGEVSKTKAAVREYVGEANQELKDGLNYIGESITAENDGAIQEALAEMNNIELGFVIAGLSEIQKQQLTDMGVEI
tara:strand:- start:1444 stop:2196 length:753 start_codon:yes stop_codon:yes gene_type:complete